MTSTETADALAMRKAAYEHCVTAGHYPINSPVRDQFLCKHCGTLYRYERRMIEVEVPEGLKPRNIVVGG